jgi:prevent-host-death family protein
MTRVTIRDLRHHGGEVVDRAAAGERITVTRSGKPVAELRPLRDSALPSAALVERWRRLPHVDPIRFREDLDAVLDDSL